MTPARFGLQATIVLVLVALVSWPEHRQLRAGAAWYGRSAATSRDAAGRGRRGTGLRRQLIGYGMASETALGLDAASALRRRLYDNDIEGRRRAFPQELRALGARVNGIVGYAVDGGQSGLPFVRMLLRNVASGQVEARGTADEQGRFAFLDVMPGGYVIELLDEDGGTTATSDVLRIGVSELRTATVRGGAGAFTSFGAGLDPAAHDTVAAAADQGVNRIAAPEQCASPPCGGSAR